MSYRVVWDGKRGPFDCHYQLEKYDPVLNRWYFHEFFLTRRAAIRRGKRLANKVVWASEKEKSK